VSEIVPDGVADEDPGEAAPGDAAGVVVVADEPFVEEELDVTSVGGGELAEDSAPQPVTTKARRVSATRTRTIERMSYS